jgi:hypothetical protein
MTLLLCWHGQKVMPMPITMDPSYYQQLESQLEDYKKWTTKGAIIEGYVVNDLGEEKIAIDFCSHISIVSQVLLLWVQAKWILL